MSRIRIPDITGVVVAVLLTHVLQSLFTIPRLLLEVALMNVPWDGVGDPMRFHTAVFAILDFLFALFVGTLAMRGCRFIVPGSNASSVFVVATIFALVFAFSFAVAEAIWPLNIPGMFVPPCDDAGYALPGWIIAYYFGIGTEARKELSTAVVTTLGIATAALAIVLPLFPVRHLPAINQSYIPHVNSTFTPVPKNGTEPPSNGNSLPAFTPVPETFTPVPQHNQPQ